MILTSVVSSIVLVRKGERLHRFSYRFLWTAIVISGLSAIGRLPMPQTFSDDAMQKRMSEIAREAAGTKPVDDSGTPQEREMRGIMRDFFRAVFNDRKQHDADANVHALDLASLYSAKSFSSKAAMKKTMLAVDGINGVDKEFSRRFQLRIDEMRRRMEASTMNASEKREFLKGVDQGLANSNALKQRRELMATEDDWVRATDDLYAFALQHASQIKAVGKQIVLSDNQVKQQFDQRFSQSRDARKKLEAGNQQWQSQRERKMNGLGLSESDLGLKK